MIHCTSTHIRCTHLHVAHWSEQADKLRQLGVKLQGYSLEPTLLEWSNPFLPIALLLNDLSYPYHPEPQMESALLPNQWGKHATEPGLSSRCYRRVLGCCCSPKILDGKMCGNSSVICQSVLWSVGAQQEVAKIPRWRKIRHGKQSPHTHFLYWHTLICARV